MRRGRLGYLSPDALSGFGPSLLGALFLHVHSYHQAAPPQSSSGSLLTSTLGQVNSSLPAPRGWVWDVFLPPP